MTCPVTIKNLITRFNDNKESYTGTSYNETQLRREFVDPFFKSLGWDVDNEQGYAEAYKDVIHEDSIKIGSATKAPDYCFRIGGVRKFFVETKKPSVNLKDDISPAFQVRRYAWSAKLPLSILTDFEEFAVYDCREKPVKTDKASKGRILYLTFEEYESKWDEIEKVFSKEAILKGSFDKYAETAKGKRGTSEVDNEFLVEIERWRELLAKNIAIRNPALTQRELNFSVQRTIDRIIFLRICEDRGIEHYGTLMALLNGDHVYERMRQNFRKADEVYNSGLFHFRNEKGRAEPPDVLTLNLNVDDKPLKEIIKNLYYPESPYEFSVLPSDILGQVYERFLGSVIRLTKGHQAKVEVKPEVKKAGGVFYTPTYIVDYIVKNTVGKLIQGKSPRQIEKIKILDPACGSGSFLIQAYQYLLDYHRDWYTKDGAEKHAKGKNPKLIKIISGEWRLSTPERKKILLNNIFGVDIDSQAVEVTKLSLLLKVLEGENEQSLAQQMSLFHERALPDLENNIKCGNSLICSDFYNETQLSFFDDDEKLRINAFDWNNEFKNIMQNGGFDAVIGNPPYGAFFDKAEKEYIQRHFNSYKYRFDSYIYFIETALNLSNVSGYISFITPELWLKLENCINLRKLIMQNSDLQSIWICGENVFSAAVVNTIVFTIRKNGRSHKIELITNKDNWDLPKAEWERTEGYCIDYRIHPKFRTIIDKIRAANKLSNYGESIQGITPYDKYRGQSTETIKTRAYHFDLKKNKTCGKWLKGKDLTRFAINWSGEWLSYGPWLAAPREKRFFEGKRLLFREVPGKGKRIQASYSEDTYYHGHSITPFLPFKENKIDILFLLAVVNSKLISWYGGLTLPNFGKDIFPKLNPQDIKEIPIPHIEIKNLYQKAIHDEMVSYVKGIDECNKKLHNKKISQEKAILLREIGNYENQIDNRIYKLFKLSDKEIEELQL